MAVINQKKYDALLGAAQAEGYSQADLDAVLQQRGHKRAQGLVERATGAAKGFVRDISSAMEGTKEIQKSIMGRKKSLDVYAQSVADQVSSDLQKPGIKNKLKAAGTFGTTVLKSPGVAAGTLIGAEGDIVGGVTTAGVKLGLAPLAAQARAILPTAAKESIKGKIQATKQALQPVTEPAQQLAGAAYQRYQQEKEAHPVAVRDIEAAGNIATAVVPKFLQPFIKEATPVTKQVAREITQDVKKAAAPMTKVAKTAAASIQKKSPLRTREVSEIVQDYRSAINPQKSDIRKIETKGGKSVDDTLQFLLEEEVIPTKTSDNRISVIDEADRLRDKKKHVDTMLASRLDDQQPKHDLSQIAANAKQAIRSEKGSALDIKRKEENVDRIIEAERERFGTGVLTDKQLHEFKNGMWSMGYDVNNPTMSPVARRMGWNAKTMIEDANPDLTIREMNNLSGKYANATDLLESIHGNVVKGGKVGGWFSRIIGGIVLEKALGKIPGIGNVAAFFGNIIGGKYNDFVNDPERIARVAIQQAKKAKLDPESMQVLKRFAENAVKFKKEPLMLPAPKHTQPYTPSVIPAEAPGILEGQQTLRDYDVAQENRLKGQYTSVKENIKAKKQSKKK